MPFINPFSAEDMRLEPTFVLFVTLRQEDIVVVRKSVPIVS